MDIEADGSVGSLAINGSDVDFVESAGNPIMTAPLTGVIDLPPSGLAATDNVSITVDGTTAISGRTFTMTGSLVMDTDNTQTSGATYTLVGGTTHTWTAPSSSPIDLVGRFFNGNLQMRWTGSTGSQIELHLDGALRKTLNNNEQISVSGSRWLGQTVSFQVCEVGGVNCSNSVSITFVN
ncbi:MAG TPA: hypothetical protein EYG53_02390 [Gammaproteobacteria bacterium]|nr:hypothetical protein [Gammaproteobacteria bacterium]